ncbi:MAG TPA: hypothetical protein VJZ71_06775 [Phycisphaerae bacterium]|nr:hypothetical protein [Phycisphaerae bacterium]
MPAILHTLLASTDAAAHESSFIESVKGFIDALCAPYYFVPLTTAMLIIGLATYRRWTRPAAALMVLFVFTAFYGLSMLDEDFFKIIKKPDNVPITMMIYFTGFCSWLGLRQAALNDERIERGEPLIESGADDKVLVWPDLVYTELICLVLCTLALIVWAIILKAPLEPPANPTNIPNPSKAPWYFLGLQELLVYFDPWIAGVLLPGLIIVGLISLPYLDKNPRGNGYFTFKERPMVISIYMFGFVIMWVVLIVLGTFLRGPNWNLFGPYETWDPHRPAALLNINVSDVFWVVLPEKLGLAWWKPGLPTQSVAGVPAFLIREAPGLVLVGGYFFILPVILARTVFRKIYAQIGLIRFCVFWLLLSWMFIVPIKMVLRWLVNMKYFVAITEFFFNI